MRPASTKATGSPCWALDQGGENVRIAAIPATLWRLIWRVSARHQLWLAVLSIAVFAAGIAPLEFQRRIVNDAFAGGRAPEIIAWAGAYAAVALRLGSAAAQQSAFRSFVERFYGTGWSSSWRAIFDTYYRIAPHRPSCAPRFSGPRLPVPWASEVDLREILRGGGIDASPYARLHARLLSVGHSVRQNQGDFSALALSADYLAHAFWRQAAVEQARHGRGRSAGSLLERIAERDRTMVEKLDADWNGARFSDSPGKLEAAPGLEPADQLLFRMRQAAEFSAQLVRGGDRTRRILNSGGS